MNINCSAASSGRLGSRQQNAQRSTSGKPPVDEAAPGESGFKCSKPASSPIHRARLVSGRQIAMRFIARRAGQAIVSIIGECSTTPGGYGFTPHPPFIPVGATRPEQAIYISSRDPLQENSIFCPCRVAPTPNFAAPKLFRQGRPYPEFCLYPTLSHSER